MRDPYRIWISEIMLQQTRVAAVIPYYEKFLDRFPDVAALARAPEAAVLASWSGLGYYSRARNLRKAARQILERGGFPRDCAGLGQLAGIGDYTAAAIASIAFGRPHAVLDGNVIRVLSRLAVEDGDITAAATRSRLRNIAEGLLDRRRPGEFNQALMELGATVCLPRAPLCGSCPLRESCRAFREGRQDALPVKRPAARRLAVEVTLLVVKRRGCVLLWKRPAGSQRLAGFWELPEAEQLPAAVIRGSLGVFRHSITNHLYRCSVVEASLRRVPKGFRWVDRQELARIPLSTTARKAVGRLEL